MNIEEKAKDISELLKILSNKNRLLILCYLLEEPMNVSGLHEKMEEITQPALSQHLSILKSSQIIDSKKQGQTITYSIKDQRIKEVMEVLKQNYCV